MIAEIAVVGGERIDTAQVRALSLLRVGDRWTPIVRDRALQALRSLPAVRDVQISTQRLRRGEVRVVVELQEREPFGLVFYEGVLYWVDSDGYLLEGASAFPPPLEFPPVQGVSVEDTPRGRRVTPERVRGLLREFFALDGRTLARIRALRVRPYDVEVELRGGKRVYLPLRGWRGSLERLWRAAAALEAAGKGDWHVLDLRVEGEVTVRR